MNEQSLLRMLDANLNRVSEALRVVEDVCRFHWDFGGYAAALKSLRHDVFRILAELSVRQEDLCRERDIEDDVGRETRSPDVGELSPEDLALRNLQRAKEALRVIQECVRSVEPAAEGRIQEARYRLYAEEKGLVRLAGTDFSQCELHRARLYVLVMPELVEARLEDVVTAVIAGGADVVQLRVKAGLDRQFIALARRIRELVARSGALFIVNDRADIARLVSADGVHLGQDDLSLKAARQILGERAIIGISTHSAAQARAAERQGADYIGVGPAFATSTKEDHEPVLGVELAASIAAQSSVPAFVIGGIDGTGLRDLAAAGCRRVAVASALLRASDPESTARQFKAALTRTSHEPPAPAPRDGSS